MEMFCFIKKPKIFYGYWIVAVTFIVLLIFSGAWFYSFSLYIQPLQVDFGWSRGQIMTALTISFLSISGTAPFVGRLVDRYGVRRVMTIGASVAAGGFVLLSQTHSLWQFYAGSAVVGIGNTATGIIPATTVVSNWFKKRRGTALGIMATGIGAGGVIMPQLIGNYLIPNFGWGRSYLVLALIVCITIPLVLLVMKTKPQDMGLYPDGVQDPEAVAEAKASTPDSAGLTMKMALGVPVFWLIAVSYLANAVTSNGMMQTQVPYLMDIGFSVATGVTVLTLVGVGSIIGKFTFGWLCDRIQAKYAWSIAASLMIVSVIMLMNVGPTSSLAAIWLYAIIMGVGFGGWLPTMSFITSTNFGLTSYGTIFGMVVFAQGIGMATGPLIAGYMYDMTNTYTMAFIIFIALSVVTILTALAIRRPKSLPNFKRG